MITSLTELLARFHACEESRNWASALPADTTIEQAWQMCERGDWVLWIAAKMGVDRRLVVMAGCGCARLALPHVTAGETRPLAAIETAESWCRGEATLEMVRAAADAAAGAAYAATAYAATVDAARAARAAYAAAYAARAARAAEAAAYAVRAARAAEAATCTARAADAARAARAAEAAAYAARAARAAEAATCTARAADRAAYAATYTVRAADAAYPETLALCADIARLHIPWAAVDAAITALESQKQ